MKPAAILRAAGALVAAGWTRQTWARNANGDPCSWDFHSARCFCAGGAIAAAGQKLAGARAQATRYALKFLREAAGNADVAIWNDAKERTHAEVLAAFERAAELADKADAKAKALRDAT